MKIERISDNQIRCILTEQDLQDRNLRLSELAYGTDRAKTLFREMMEQANIDFGFEAEDIPIMIEAIPTSRGAIVLVITKVEDPDEFEDKLSHVRNLGDLSCSTDDCGYDDSDEDDSSLWEIIDETDDAEDREEVSFSATASINGGPPRPIPDELIDCFGQLGDLLAGARSAAESIPSTTKKKKKKDKKKTDCPQDFSYLFSFSSLEEMIEIAHQVNPIYNDKSTLWKDELSNSYYLYLSKSRKKKEDPSVVSVVSQIAEYAREEKYTYATRDYLNEHCRIIVKDQAIPTLAKL